jgi:polysaccharide biosynthesis transport protein
MFRNDISHFSPPAAALLSAKAANLTDVAAGLWRGRYWTLSTALACGVLAIGLSQWITPSYRAGAQVFIDPQNLQLLERDLAPSVAGGDAGVVLIESQARVMASDSVLRAVAADLDLDEDPEFIGSDGPLKTFANLLNGSSNGAADPMQRAVAALGKAVYVVRLDRTYVVDVHAASESATKAAAIANAVVHHYIRLRETQRSDQAGRASSALQGRLAQLLLDLEAAENAVESFKAENGIVASGGQLLLEGNVGQSSQALANASVGVQSARIQLEQLRAAAPGRIAALPEALASPDMVRLRGELQAAVSEASVLAATLGARHPRLLAAGEKVAGANIAIAAELDRLLANAELNLERARDNEAALSARLSGLTGALQRTDSNRVRLRQLEREAEASRAIYEDALLRSRETAEQAQIDTLNAQIVSEAAPPATRSFPSRLTLLLPVAVLFGLCLGAAISLGLDRLRSRHPGGHG